MAAIATLRSDFYPQAQASLQRLKGDRGHFDLLPPDATALQRMAGNREWYVFQG